MYQAKNFLEVVTFRALQENLSRYRRIDKTTYLDCSTGELKTYRRKERSSTDQATKCKRSYVVLRRILLANFTASKSELHIVLTVKPQRGADLPSLNQYFRTYGGPVDQLDVPTLATVGESTDPNVQYMGQLDTEAEAGQAGG